MSEKQHFTLVFEGDIRSFKSNPFHVETAFGKPVACGIGNAFDKIAELEERLDASDEVDRLLWGSAALRSTGQGGEDEQTPPRSYGGH